MITAEYVAAGMQVRDHVVTAPLDWARPDERTIQVFARELCSAEKAGQDLPVLLFLQGGPGGKGPRPVDKSGWIGEALKTHRLLLLDQRGTGRSSRITAASMERFDSAADGAEYLGHFRADSIVSDAEFLRKTVFGGRKWSTLGQSYGGFLTLTYLSQAPEALDACYITGGLPSLTPDALEVYRRTYVRTKGKNLEFYARYGHHVETMAKIADRLAVGDVYLADGDRLTVRRFQSLGIDYGMKPGFERMAWLIDEAFDDSGELSDTFLAQVQARSNYAENPLFAVMQESIFADGASGATAWAAQRELARHPEFAESARPLMMTGEMMYPWMFEEIRLLKPFGAAVNEMARRDDWGPLYDPKMLAENQVPVAAVVYHDDMYVDAPLSLETAAQVGNLQAWVTNEFEHDGISSPSVFPRLVSMVESVGGPLA
ncbi:alpha/beta fold hydrolase [Paeniglutamicibacter sp. NPDC012692]|uniref:alpha/beta fold hydrolase n=1 Tax=Paeniglutamicibacter sp. NPDC012692 TaxID=3364388 RepID=UPI00368B7844